MSYDYSSKKIVGIVATNVDPSLALNIIGHLGVAVGAYADRDIMGKNPILDKSGTKHTGIAKFPFIITKIKSGKLRQAIEAARLNPDILVIDYPREMLDTRHDDELVEAIGAKEEGAFEYLGAVLYGNTADVDAITGRFQLWRVDK